MSEGGGGQWYSKAGFTLENFGFSSPTQVTYYWPFEKQNLTSISASLIKQEEQEELASLSIYCLTAKKKKKKKVLKYSNRKSSSLL